MSEDQACRNQCRQWHSWGSGEHFQIAVLGAHRRAEEAEPSWHLCVSPFSNRCFCCWSVLEEKIPLCSSLSIPFLLSYNPTFWIISPLVSSVSHHYLAIPFLPHSDIIELPRLLLVLSYCSHSQLPRLVGNIHSLDSSSLQNLFLDFFPSLHLSREEHGLPSILWSCWFDSLPLSTVPRILFSPGLPPWYVLLGFRSLAFLAFPSKQICLKDSVLQAPPPSLLQKGCLPSGGCSSLFML